MCTINTLLTTDNTFVTGLMPDKPEKVIEILSQYGELSMVKLIEKTGVRRNDLFDLIPKMEKEKIVITKIIGREKLVRLFSPKKSIDRFIKNYPKRLKHFEKSLETELKALEKTLPLVSITHPLKNVKVKRPVLELDKKTNIWTDMGKTEVSHARTFKTRPTSEKHFVKILNLLYNLYQESSSLNFVSPIIDDYKLLRNYQNRSEKMIKEITDRTSKMILKQDPNSIVYVNYRLRNVLYGLIYKETLKQEMKV